MHKKAGSTSNGMKHEDRFISFGILDLPGAFLKLPECGG